MITPLLKHAEKMLSEYNYTDFHYLPIHNKTKQFTGVLTEIFRFCATWHAVLNKHCVS